eukprot:CAMPEP_0183794758 /NCGR_PEP_ID=MMETSP0803_2-20130417/4027_1 /TAXON_ID=195967 /ORGANISM="Crustomastix stigmata, Strain CCMP3273" /LENGTH=71 /DNA_ID=CAMNT_0026039163 /DNA_START=85 /DNA_END=296 /DNA_ORIENTATION=+
MAVARRAATRVSRAARRNLRRSVRVEASGLPPPSLYDFNTVTSKIKPSPELVAAVEDCFGQLAKGKVDVPL